MALAKLPTLTYESLNGLLGEKSGAKIGHATTARRLGEFIEIAHHGSPIAVLYPDNSARVSLAGWGSMSTIGRVNKVLVDGLKPKWPNARWHCSRRNWEPVFIRVDESGKELQKLSALNHEWWGITARGDKLRPHLVNERIQNYEI